ncbi:TPA: phage tail tape measure protein [Enterobacter hormaechei]
MASNFSVGVVIGGMVGSTFRSAVSGTRRALDSLNDTSRRLQERQNALTRATERYGQLGSSRMLRLNSDLLRLSRTMEQIERQQRRLSAVSATSDALKTNRMALYGQGVEAYAMAQTVYHTVSPAVQQSMSFKDKMIDMSITAKYDDKTRDTLAEQIKGWALKYNQYQDDMQDAVGSLISDNIDNVSDIGYLMPDIARAATATRTAGQDWAKVAAVWQNSLKGAAKDFGAVQNIMAYAGDQGSFEIPDQVKWMQSLAPMMAGVASGKEAVAEIGASLQIAKIGAGSTDEAANNFKNFLTKIFARDTQKQFADLGVDLQGSIESYKAAGISPIEGMMSVIERYLNAKSPEALAGFKSAMKIKNDTARDEALQALAKNFGLGEMFADMQVMAFVRPMLSNMDRYREIRAGALKAADNDLLGNSYDQRLKSPLEATKALVVNSRDLAITLGDQLAPSFISLAQELLPLIQGAKHWVAAHPQFVSGTFKVITALIAFKIAVIGLKLGINLLISPFVNVWKSIVLLQSSWLRLTLALGEGGKLRWLVTGFSAVARGARTLGGVLSGGLVRGIMIAGRAVLWIGRALLMNPIGLAITAVAAAAYLIYRNWGAVSNWFKQRWADIKTAFNGGIVGIGKLLLNWSPVGLLYKAFAGALKYLGIDLPAQFTDFGGHLIDGLVNGIKNKWESVKSTVSDLGDNVGGWFKEKLGIHSPSRVFMGFGDNIAQGASIGIKRTTPAAALAGQQMANQLFPNTPPSIQGPKIIDNTSGFRLGMPSLDTDGLLSSARDKLGGVINSLSSMPAIRLSTAATALPEQRRAGEINQNAYSLPSPDISGLLSFARNAFGELINSLSPMPAMRIPAAAPTLTGQRIANEMTPDVPRIPSPEIMAAGYSGHGAASTGGGTSGGIQVSFNPQFFLNGKETAAPDGLTGALNMSLHELEKMLERLLAQKQRRGYE